MVLGHDVLEFVDRLGGDSMLHEVLLNVGLELASKVLFELALDEIRFGPVQPQRGRVLRVLGSPPQIAQTDGLQKVLVLGDAVDAQADVPVFAGILADRAQVLMARARTGVGYAGVEVIHHVVRADAQERLVHRQIDALPLARRLGLVQGGQRRGDDHERVEIVARIGGNVHRLLGRAVLCDDSSVCGDREIVGGGVDHGRIAPLAEPRNVDDDEGGIGLPQHLVGDPLAGERRALGGLDEDIGLLDQTAKDLLAFVGKGVHGDRALVAPLHLLRPRGVPHRVARPHVFDPRDVGAPLGHDLGRGGSGDLDRRIEDPDVVQRAERRLCRFHV